YTHTEATEVNSGTSSQNTSNWNNNPIYVANEEVAYDSRYAFEHRFTGILTKEWKFFGDNKTSASVVYEGRSGRPYSLVYFNDFNGDSRSANDLFYVPSGPGDVIFPVPGEEVAFCAYLEAHPEINRYRGQVAPANSLTAKFMHNFDVRLTQEIPGFMDGHKAELTLDIMNIGNLFNDDWGQIDDYGFFSTRRIGNFAGIDPATGKYV